MEIIVLPATGEQDGVFGEGTGRGLTPYAAGEWLIYTVIVELGPEELL